MIPPITISLLDSGQGHSLQSWTFDNHDTITVGRSLDNDIVLTDPYVSRSHAYLRFDDGEWRLIAISRRMIVSGGRVLPEVPVSDGTVCRLGPQGCHLRFEQSARNQNRATISFDSAITPEWNLDREKVQEELDQFEGDPFFQRLKSAVRERRAQSRQEEVGQ